MPAVRAALQATRQKGRKRADTSSGGEENHSTEDPSLHANGRHLSAIVKFNLGLFQDVTPNELVDVFNHLDEDSSGHLEMHEFAKLLQSALSPPCTDEQVQRVFQVINKAYAHGVTVTADEFQSAMSSGLMEETLAKMRREAEIRNLQEAEEKKKIKTPIPRQMFCDKIEWRVSRDDSFYALPFSILFIFVFQLVVMTHLRIFGRQNLQRAMEEWVEGFGDGYPGPYLPNHVGVRQQMLEWLDLSGLPSAFSGCEIGGFGEPACPVAPNSLLVGDAKITQTLMDGSQRSEWLLHSPEAEAHLAVHPLEFTAAANKKLKALWDWVEEDVTKLEYAFTTYTSDVETFAVTRSNIEIRLDGVVVDNCVSRAVPIAPYSSWGLFVIDGAYVLMVLYSVCLELQSLYVRGLVGYCDHGGIEGAWNLVDLFGIVMGIANTVQWVLFVLLTQSPEIRDVLQQVDGKYVLLPSAMSFSVPVIQALQDRLDGASFSSFLMQIAMATNVVSIMFKLFKAFGANARLQLVTSTMEVAASDLVHFGIVFGALFIGFALMGHILFGEDIEEFRSFPLAINTAFESLLGDFDWFSSICISNKDLGSGLPFTLVVVWFYLFMVFIVLVMMNMLLAIVMDHYGTEVAEIKSDLDNAPTLWRQCHRVWQRHVASKGFIAGEKILYQMVDAHPPIHPETVITKESLRNAFTQMPDTQIDTLVKWMQKEVDKTVEPEESEAENIKLLKELRTIGSDIADLVKIVTHSSCETAQRLQFLETTLEDVIRDRSSQKETKAIQGMDDNTSVISKGDPNKAYEEFGKVVSGIRDVKERWAQQNSQDEMESKAMAAANIPVRNDLSFGCCNLVTARPSQRVATSAPPSRVHSAREGVRRPMNSYYDVDRLL